MENVSRALMLGFATVIFAAALAITVVLYNHADEFMNVIASRSYYRNVMAGE